MTVTVDVGPDRVADISIINLGPTSPAEAANTNGERLYRWAVDTRHDDGRQSRATGCVRHRRGAGWAVLVRLVLEAWEDSQ